MMMAQKHLHELLREDQEPFILKNYIADRRFLLQRPTPKTQFQADKIGPIVETSSSKRGLCNQACFFSLLDSPDVENSPLVYFPATAKGPCKSPNGALQSSSSKPKLEIKYLGSVLFGPIVKRLIGWKNGSRNREIGTGKSKGKSEKVNENACEKSEFEVGFACSCGSRSDSVVWSERNEETSPDLETSLRSWKSEDRENVGLGFCEKRFCTSPFRFALQKSPPSSPHLLPDFSSPATSPSRQVKQEKNCEAEGTQQIHLEEKEEKEQCSPVSVLDPPFKDDEDGGGDGDDDNDEEEGYDLEERNNAILQRAKQQLLDKLHRFEKLAGLDPIELEKSMLEEQEEDDKEHLIKEEEVVVVKRVYRERLDLWKEVESNSTIDMMVELDFRGDFGGWWKRNDQKEVGETTVEIELAIFGNLVEELSKELCLTGH
ncbi:hypothetical protein Acr_20g0005630 [Actinidia rufa]|uniref:Uncharacterized protein n=1 Tax=Actinidia rufa TaxID=165716 RepID=A0A7J0GD53_9ERIC|nr:hypothetical protein Acr_20g0005630 [Actinidia rufa]